MASVDQLVSASGNGQVAVIPVKARIPQHVVYRSLVSETVMLNVQTGKYYGLNQTAGRMLELLERGREFDAIVTQLATEFEAPEDTIRNDFLALCTDLAEKGLIEIESAPAGERD
jgi:Coenzyme PQQ synthesis protein D (PqqD)